MFVNTKVALVQPQAEAQDQEGGNSNRSRDLELKTPASVWKRRQHRKRPKYWEKEVIPGLFSHYIGRTERRSHRWLYGLVSGSQKTSALSNSTETSWHLLIKSVDGQTLLGMGLGDEWGRERPCDQALPLRQSCRWCASLLLPWHYRLWAEQRVTMAISDSDWTPESLEQSRWIWIHKPSPPVFLPLSQRLLLPFWASLPHPSKAVSDTVLPKLWRGLNKV